MSHNFSQIIKALSQPLDSSMYRQIIIFAGEEKWQKDTLKDILNGHYDNALWVAEDVASIFQSISVKQAHSWLGREKKIVIFDANREFDADAFAAISGIVVGGGFFILLMPDEEKWNKVYSSAFGQRLIQSIYSENAITYVRQSDENIYFNHEISTTNLFSNCSAPFLTSDQQNAVENIEGQVLKKTKNPVVLISDRGRGKSASLGISAARLLHAGIKHIAITAPRLRAVDIVFKHITELLPGAVSTRGKVEFSGNIIQFYSPDQLIEEDISADLLLVDEAAAIPVPLLTSFLQKYTQCVFATTVHGYEGTGRGFALRFFKVLDQNKPAWQKLKMEMPIRWPANDPLEKWMFSLLCLDAEIIHAESIAETELDKLNHQLLTKEQLLTDQTLLNEVFALLVLAHYRTRPKDLKSLLDDEDLFLYVTLQNKHVLAVALVISEGSFSEALSTSVYRGERRPQGHLLAQALTYHCGIEQAAVLNYSRVMRIAVHPGLQQQGIGTSLLNFVINSERQTGRDAIGSSFGMNEKLLNFWKTAKFNVVRIGFTREQTSGEHAAIMLLPLSEAGIKVNEEACNRFNTQISFWLSDILKDIPLELKKYFQTNSVKSQELSEREIKDLDSFKQYSRNYELCISALNKLVTINQQKIAETKFPVDFQKILNCKVINKKSWKDIRKEMNLSGQSEARKLFHKAIVYLMEQEEILLCSK
ncbi:tRNA(Met) cytidine acetyltransferase [Candidatus Pacearchaeota archaeon]|nr:tRNA(Met) cytidine acetyltransferase [Candidatus Pacearchaeota archaeon]